MASFLACARKFNLDPNDVLEVRTHIEAMGDDALGVQSYLDVLQREKADLQKSIADQGGVADFGEKPIDFSQDVTDSLKEVRSTLADEPVDIIKTIRNIGGIKNDGGELDAILDQSARTIRRNDGLEPDMMRELLVEAGFLDEGATINDMWDAMRANVQGDKVYSKLDANDADAFNEAVVFRDSLEAATQKSFSDIKAEDIIGLETKLGRNQKTTGAKAQEAGRSAKKAGKVEDAAGDRVVSAFDRLDAAVARIADLDGEISPKVRDEIKAANDDLRKILPELEKAKKARSADEFYEGKTDDEIEADIDDVQNSILGLKPGEHSYSATLSSPTRARVLDVHDDDLIPWLETDASVVMAQYFHGVVPDIEITRRFGDINMTEVKRKIVDEKDRLVRNSKTEKERLAHAAEAENRIRELDAMRDRIRGTYGVPKNPKDIIVRAGRGIRTLSYTGYLGGMTLSAIPDVANVIGRGGIEAAFGSLTALTDPKRMGLALKDARDLGAAAEWWLNSRAVSIAEITDDYGQNTKFERGLGATGRAFGTVTGMIPWNAGWKSVGGAVISSKMSKAAVAISKGNATKKQLITMAENGIDSVMAQRIGAQIEQFGDMGGDLWLPQAGKWADKDAFEAFRNAFNREIDIMIITPGQDKPLWFSNEAGKFISQFKTFAASAQHRILLSGLQRKDAAVLGQVTTAVLLGKLVSNIKADLGGYDRKEGAAAWEDAVDRSGLAGWFFEAHGVANAFAGGGLSISGEKVSRFQSRSSLQGLAGPSFDMAVSFGEGVAAASQGKMSSRDARKVLRPVPGNNLPYFLGLTNTVADAMSDRNKN